MFREIKKRVKNEKGLTLIELLAVIVILAIIAAIAIPAIGNIINNSRDKAILSEALNIMSGAKIAHMDGQCEDNKCDDDVLKNYVDGVSLTADDSVTYNQSTNTWSIDYSRFEEIDENSDYHVADTGVTETEIKSIIDPN